MELSGVWLYYLGMTNNPLTTKEAAEKLNVSVRRVQALITKGQLKAQKIGRDYIIDGQDLTRIKSGKVGRPKKKKTGKKFE